MGLTLGQRQAVTNSRAEVPTPGARSVGLASSASTDAAGVTGYAVLRSTSGKPGSYARVATSSVTSYTDGGLRRGKTYWLRHPGVRRRGQPQRDVGKRVVAAVVRPGSKLA